MGQMKRSDRDAVEDLRRRLEAAEAKAALVDRMEIPESPYDALLLAEAAFPDRLVALEPARRSAKGFSEGKAGEVWSALQAMAVTLHPLVFASRQPCDIAVGFRAATGFELALRDVKMAKRNPAYAKKRQAYYKGAWRDATPHVKGRSPKPGRALRIHFFADYEERVLVIAHCGEHMDDFNTRRL